MFRILYILCFIEGKQAVVLRSNCDPYYILLYSIERKTGSIFSRYERKIVMAIFCLT